MGLAAGIGCGVVFGEYCAGLSVIGDAFIGLLRMAVLPYIVVSLIASLGRLSLRESRLLASVGGLTLLLLWGAGLLMVFALPMSFPEWKAGSFYSTTTTEALPQVEFLSLFIPANVFTALSENRVPAVVIACIGVGLALSGVGDRHQLIAQLDVLAKALMRISGFIARLAPIGVFAIAASTSGTISFEEMARLQAYFLTYTGGALMLGFVVLPLLVTTLTPFRYREVLAVARAPMLMAFTTGKLIIVLPMLIEQTEELIQRYRRGEDNQPAPALDVLYPVAYAFPHVGKLLAMLFIPFAAWFLGNAMTWDEYPRFLTTGLFAYFGGPILATPYLLDEMQLPHDMFQLFLLSGVYAERLGDALGAMHLLAFTLIAMSAFTGRLILKPMPIMKSLLIVSVTGVFMIGGMRLLLARPVLSVESKSANIARMHVITHPVESIVLQRASPNPDPLRSGETLLERVRRRGAIRVGFNEDKLPFAFFNASGDLVGFDVNMAHALARDLGVRIEFVRFERATLAPQLAEDEFDVVMSGLVGTLERSEAMQHTNPYMDVTLALVVPDHRVRSFKSIASMQSMDRLRIGFVDLSLGFVDRLRSDLSNAELIELQTTRVFFEEPELDLDALLISAESGSAFTLLYPEFEVVVPTHGRVSLPLFYGVGARDSELRDFLDHWVTLRRKDGTMQAFYDHWVLGKNAHAEPARWSVVRDVLGWVE